MTDATGPPGALAELRRGERADVWKGDRLAGHLTRQDSDVVFTYDASYARDASAPPIAHTLAKDALEVRTPAGAAPPFFAGLLPEGVRLQATAAATKTSLDDHLTLLLAVGGDAIGDVRILLAGEAPQPPVATVTPDDLSSARLSEVYSAAIGVSPDTLERVALPGVQAKVSARMLSAPLGTTSGPAILKLDPERAWPRLIENEHFFLAVAAASGLPTPAHRLVYDRDGRSGLLVERFDREASSHGIRLLAQEDACQVLAQYPAAKYRLKTEVALAELASAVQLGGGSRRLALRRGLEIVALCYLIGNGDLHGKNLSVRSNPAQVWELTPAYDLITTQPYLGWRDPMALDLHGRANRLDRRHLLSAAERLGLPRRSLAAALDRICEAAPAWIDRLDEIGWVDRTTTLLAEFVRRRLAELRGDRQVA